MIFTKIKKRTDWLAAFSVCLLVSLCFSRALATVFQTLPFFRCWMMQNTDIADSSKMAGWFADLQISHLTFLLHFLFDFRFFLIVRVFLEACTTRSTHLQFCSCWGLFYILQKIFFDEKLFSNSVAKCMFDFICLNWLVLLKNVFACIIKLSIRFECKQSGKITGIYLNWCYRLLSSKLSSHSKKLQWPTHHFDSFRRYETTLSLKFQTYQILFLQSFIFSSSCIKRLCQRLKEVG